MSVRLHFLFSMLVAVLIPHTGGAQELSPEIRQEIGKFLDATARKEVSIGHITIDSVAIKGNALQLFANMNCSYIPFRENNVAEIYQGISALLPAELTKYRLQLHTNKHCIEELIPQALRSKKDKKALVFSQEVKKPLVTKVSSPYTPTNGLQNRHIALWQSHGFYYELKLDRWEWQRARCLQTVEDLYTQSFVLPYLVPMLENAGANVLIPRERDCQTAEIIIDNDGCLNTRSIYTEKVTDKPWMQGVGKGFAHLRPLYTDFENPFKEGTFRTIETIKKGKESVKKIPEPFERKRRAIEERFSSLSQEKIREIEKRKEQGDAAEQRVSVLAKNSMENNVRDSVQGNDGNNAQNPIQNPAQNTTGNMSGSVNGYSGVHGENSENATEISNRRSSIEERIARLHVGENNAIKKEIDDVIPKSMDESTAKAEEYSESDDRQIKQDKKPSGQKELLKEADTYGKGTQMSFADVPLLSEEARPKHRIIGQVFRTYWLVEFDEKLFFVDQHAAHEKVMYEKLKKDLENNTIVQQMVAPPVILTFSIKEQQKFKICEESFKKLGFLIEEFGGNEYCIRGVPANLLGIDPQELFIEIFDQIEENSGKMNLEMITDRLATMACKAAVKGNTAMSYQEMDALMDQLMKLDNPYQCPHGRPTIISMTKYELEKKFKRVQ